MGYLVKPSSATALRMKRPRITNKRPLLDSNDNGEFPFRSLLPGQSFFMQYNENSHAKIAKALAKRLKFNREFAAYFIAISHFESLEFARLA